MYLFVVLVIPKLEVTHVTVPLDWLNLAVPQQNKDPGTGLDSAAIMQNIRRGPSLSATDSVEARPDTNCGVKFLDRVDIRARMFACCLG